MFFASLILINLIFSLMVVCIIIIHYHDKDACLAGDRFANYRDWGLISNFHISKFWECPSEENEWEMPFPERTA